MDNRGLHSRRRGGEELQFKRHSTKSLGCPASIQLPSPAGTGQCLPGTFRSSPPVNSSARVRSGPSPHCDRSREPITFLSSTICAPHTRTADWLALSCSIVQDGDGPRSNGARVKFTATPLFLSPPPDAPPRWEREVGGLDGKPWRSPAQSDCSLLLRHLVCGTGSGSSFLFSLASLFLSSLGVREPACRRCSARHRPSS